MVKRKKNGFYELVNKRSRLINVRQKAPEVFDLSTVAYVAKPEYIMKSNSIFAGNLDINIINRINAIDIDDYIDWKIVKKFI